MATKMTVNGVSTTQKGQEQYETFSVSTRPKRTAVQYDYRSAETGELFTCVRPTLAQCRLQRDLWLKQKGLTN
jgi:hypothetical protein